jgi:hypothetical protein
MGNRKSGLVGMVAIPDKINPSNAVFVSSTCNVSLFRKAVIFEVLKARRHLVKAEEVSAELPASENQLFRAPGDGGAVTRVV